MKLPIYFDNAATTPVDKRVAEKMQACLTLDGVFGNPASTSHPYGWEASKRVDEARAHVADLVNADLKEIIWTSGATESDNLAIQGVANFYSYKGQHIITSATEHKAVLDTCKFLEKKGFEVTYLSPEPNGLLDLEKLKRAIKPETILMSIMHVNNEIGVIQDIEAIGAIAHEHDIIFHVDAAQSAGKLPIDLKKLKVDLMSFASHKIYGPKGIGALYVKRKPRIRLEALIHGGGHEQGLRSGTLPTHQIVGMGEAFRIAALEMDSDVKRIRALRDRFWDGIKSIEAIHVNSDLDHSYPGIFNVSFNYVEGESLMMALKDIAVSSGSACTSATLQSSYVLKALGLNDELAHSSIRFSIGRFNTEEEIDYAVALIQEKVSKLRALSPLWDMYKKGIDIETYDWTSHGHE